MTVDAAMKLIEEDAPPAEDLYDNVRNFTTTKRILSSSMGTFRGKVYSLLKDAKKIGGETGSKLDAAIREISKRVADHDAEYSNPLDRNFYQSLAERYPIIAGKIGDHPVADYLNHITGNRKYLVPDELLNDPSFMAAAEENIAHLNDLNQRASNATDGAFPVEAMDVRKYKKIGPVDASGKKEMAWGDAMALHPELEGSVKEGFIADLKNAVAFDKTTGKGVFTGKKPGYLKSDSPFSAALEKAKSPAEVDALIMQEVDRLYSEISKQDAGLRYNTAQTDGQMDDFNGLTRSRVLPYAGPDAMEPVTLRDIEQNARKIRIKTAGIESLGRTKNGLPEHIQTFVNDALDAANESGEQKVHNFIGKFASGNPHTLLGHLHDAVKGTSFEKSHLGDISNRMMDHMYDLMITTNSGSAMNQEFQVLVDAITTGDGKKFMKAYQSRMMKSFRESLSPQEKGIFMREIGQSHNWIDKLRVFTRMSEGILGQVNDAVVANIPEYMSNPRYQKMLETILHDTEIASLEDYVAGKNTLADIEVPVRKLTNELSERLNEGASPYSRASFFNTAGGKLMKTFFATPFSVQAAKFAGTSEFGGGAYKGALGHGVNALGLAGTGVATIASKSNPTLRGAGLLLMGRSKLDKVLGMYLLQRGLKGQYGTAEEENRIKLAILSDVPKHLLSSIGQGELLDYKGNPIIEEARKRAILMDDAKTLGKLIVAGVPLRGFDLGFSEIKGSPINQVVTGDKPYAGQGMSLAEVVAPEFAIPGGKFMNLLDNYKKYGMSELLLRDKNPIPGLSNLLQNSGEEYLKQNMIPDPETYTGGVSSAAGEQIIHRVNKGGK